MKRTVIVTGGNGFIGSATAYYLSKAGFRVVVVDKEPQSAFFFHEPVEYVQENILDVYALSGVFLHSRPSVVIHLAALLNVRASGDVPNVYWETNVQGTKNVLDAMKSSGCKKIIFSSTASVYKESDKPVNETDDIQPLSVYAKTKHEAERIIHAEKLQSLVLRYFNVSGATVDGYFGEAVQNNPRLIPSVVRVASGIERSVIIHGSAYPTPDGTAIRDYVSLDDVVQANMCAVRFIESQKQSDVVNIGSGIGRSNLEVVQTVGSYYHREIPYSYGVPRDELAQSIAKITHGEHVLAWKPLHSSVPEIISQLERWNKRTP